MKQTMYQAKTLVFRSRSAQEFRYACKKDSTFSRNWLPLRWKDLAVRGGRNDVEIFPPFGNPGPRLCAVTCQRRWAGWFNYCILPVNGSSSLEEAERSGAGGTEGKPNGQGGPGLGIFLREWDRRIDLQSG